MHWAATQPWSTGKVGMYGKSYDANTGMVGAALRPAGLAAVVAQQVVPDRYRGSYNDRVRFLQSVAYPAVTYGSAAEGGFSPQRRPGVHRQLGEPQRGLPGAAGRALPRRPDHRLLDGPRLRHQGARAAPCPTFMTTGYLDTNTNIGGGAVDYFNALAGPKRLWIGWWDHVRGNDRVGGRLAMGRADLFDEVCASTTSTCGASRRRVTDPAVAGPVLRRRWTADDGWPPATRRRSSAALKPGSYVDDANNVGSNDAAAGPGGVGARSAASTTGAGAWTFSAAGHPPRRGSPACRQPPSAVAPVVPRVNVAVNLYDVGPDGQATMFSRGAALVDRCRPASGAAVPDRLDVFRPGHRVGVLVSGANAEAYVHVPTQQTVAVSGGSVTLPVLGGPATEAEGASNPRLESFLRTAPFTVPAATIAAGTDPAFTVG